MCHCLQLSKNKIFMLRGIVRGEAIAKLPGGINRPRLGGQEGRGAEPSLHKDSHPLPHRCRLPPLNQPQGLNSQPKYVPDPLTFPVPQSQPEPLSCQTSAESPTGLPGSAPLTETRPHTCPWCPAQGRAPRWPRGREGGN